MHKGYGICWENQYKVIPVYMHKAMEYVEKTSIKL